jgi:hypothetical protein
VDMRDLQSNNSWMRHVEVLVDGKPLLHPPRPPRRRRPPGPDRRRTRGRGLRHRPSHGAGRGPRHHPPRRWSASPTAGGPDLDGVELSVARGYARGNSYPWADEGLVDPCRARQYSTASRVEIAPA